MRDLTAGLRDAEIGRLFRAMLSYASGEEPVLPGSEQGCWHRVKELIDLQRESFSRRSGINAGNASARYGRKDARGQAEDPRGTLRSAANRSDSQEEEKGGSAPQDPPSPPSPGPLSCAPPCSPPTPRKEKPARSARFTPPSAEEVGAYCRERKNGIAGRAFTDFYEAKGWRIGREPMRDWRAAVRTWEARDRRERGARGPRGGGGQPRAPACRSGAPQDAQYTNEAFERLEVRL